MIEPYSDYPKLESPFIRKEIESHHVVTSEVAPHEAWFTDAGVLAVEKIDGTNIALYIQDNNILKVMNRKNERTLFSINANQGDIALMEGVVNAIGKSWLKELPNGWHYGELVGPSINANRHQLEKHYWVPFKYLCEHCAWNSWRDNKYPKDYESIKNWFKDLISLFNRRLKLPEIKAEGLVFYHPDGYKRCKLRRDMFLEYHQIWEPH